MYVYIVRDATSIWCAWTTEMLAVKWVKHHCETVMGKPENFTIVSTRVFDQADLDILIQEGGA